MNNWKTPDWFLEATGTPYEDRWITVQGCSIHYQLWNSCRTEMPGILFVHGHGAHAHWWDFIAPGMMDKYRIAALDVSGAGDSGHRTTYCSESFTAELASVFADAGFDKSGFIIGHSFGGRMARHAAFHYPELFAGVILVDSSISLPSNQASKQTKLRMPPVTNKPTRYYTSREEAAKRFRLRPAQPCSNDFILQYIANHSVKETNKGWCWKLDPQVFAKMSDLNSPALDDGLMIKGMACQIGIIYGGKSRLFDESIRDYLHTLLPTENIMAIPEAYHHLILDQPLEFLSALKGILNRWEV